MIPLLDRAIPLRVRNTFDATQPGTRIAADVKAGSYPVKALTAVPHQALISIEGGGMMGVPGIAGRTFGALAAAGHSVAMISQSSSEASICFVLPEAEAARAVQVLSDAFEFELRHRLIDVVRAERDMALVAVVGLGMRGTPGIASRTFGALARESINVVAIAQGSSELNITVAIHGKDVPRALTALHREYQLDRRSALATPRGREAALTLLGFGQIGRALARQLVSQSRWFRSDLGLELRCVAVADRSGVKVDEKGFAGRTLVALADRKERTGRLLSRRRTLDLDAIAGEMRERLWPLPSNRPVLVDLTAEETLPLLLEALDRGSHVVLANKKPLAVPQRDFDALFEVARRRGLSVRYEATVGAGLPVLDTLAKLREAGDQVLSVSGCLSGTIGYILTEVEAGVAFSRAVREAHTLGYTEPDPRDDLSGMDVARKALILARTLGRRLDLDDVHVEALFPKRLSHADPERFMMNLEKLDAEFAGRVETAKRAKKVLRYVARIRGNAIRVGLEAVPETTPIGRLRGTDNQIVFQTQRYRVHPLVVTGPGAGVEVTAAGVLNDLVAIATGEARHPTESRNGARRG
ncbi:MAG: ACT domain-containing protein [Planctomycetes bacterium]|nr:ACT domain-containing protein [Planctomycetota bacterium]